MNTIKQIEKIKCSERKLCDKDDCKDCFNKSFASNEKAKYWSNKNNISPRQIFKSSGKEYLFDCICGHEFKNSLNRISENIWCPYCSNSPKKLCEKEKCEKCFEKSFASHKNANYWSKENELLPRQVFKNSNAKYIFNCYKCGHEFKQSLDSISQGKWCSYCCIPIKKLCDNKDCKHCFEHSFASHEKAKFWSKKNKETPRQIKKSSDKKYIFDCDKCNHNFETSLSTVSGNHWCPYCAIPSKLLCDNKKCKVCFEKSFASHKEAKYWSDKNKLKPEQVFKCSHSKFIFNCIKGHEYKQSLNSKSKNAGCPYCINKTEQKLFDLLIKDYPTLQQQFKVSWCKKKTFLPFDFVIPEHNIIIELDGPQHFIQISNWSSPEEQNIKDKYKMECANKNNYSIIRLIQEDIFYDTYNWYNELKENIENIKNNKIIQNIYMCKNNKYDVFNDQSNWLVV